LARLRKILAALLLILVLLIAVYLGGPQRSVDTHLAAPKLPVSLGALADAVHGREDALGDVTSGCAASLSFVDSIQPAQTPVSVVYLHGFSATRQETAPLTERLAQALSANRFEARLAGHGRGGPPLGEATVEEWLADGAEALEIGRRLGRRVVVVACSTGGSLATWLLASGHADKVAALVLISPNFGPRHPAAPLLAGPWGARLVKLMVGPQRTWKPTNEAQGLYWTTSYPSQVLVEMQALVQLARGVDLKRLNTPLLMIHSEQDLVLDPAPMVSRFEEAASEPKRRVVFAEDTDPMHHVLAGDVLSPGSTDAILKEVLNFVRPLLK
jgi:alpha-beta hydrolase superfamily lysophospholipase